MRNSFYLTLIVLSLIWAAFYGYTFMYGKCADMTWMASKDLPVRCISYFSNAK